MSVQTGPLTGFRVLELGNLIAAPYVGRLFAEFGAEVIKVERPETGDELRKWRLFQGDPRYANNVGRTNHREMREHVSFRK